jgi:hypothetical protein
MLCAGGKTLELEKESGWNSVFQRQIELKMLTRGF